MPSWQVKTDPTVGSYTYSVSAGFGHALLSQVIAGVFRALRVGASLRHLKEWWWSLHDEPNLLSFEVEHSRSKERGQYNARQIAKALRTRRAQRGEYEGCCDIYVPICPSGQVVGFLIVGPFALKRPNANEILERWRNLTGRQGHLADPEFASYLSTTLGTLVLEGDRARKVPRAARLLWQAHRR